MAIPAPPANGDNNDNNNNPADPPAQGDAAPMNIPGAVPAANDGSESSFDSNVSVYLGGNGQNQGPFVPWQSYDTPPGGQSAFVNVPAPSPSVPSGPQTPLPAANMPAANVPAANVPAANDGSESSFDSNVSVYLGGNGQNQGPFVPWQSYDTPPGGQSAFGNVPAQGASSASSSASPPVFPMDPEPVEYPVAAHPSGNPPPANSAASSAVNAPAAGTVAPHNSAPPANN